MRRWVDVQQGNAIKRIATTSDRMFVVVDWPTGTVIKRTDNIRTAQKMVCDNLLRRVAINMVHSSIVGLRLRSGGLTHSDFSIVRSNYRSN